MGGRDEKRHNASINLSRYLEKHGFKNPSLSQAASSSGSVPTLVESLALTHGYAIDYLRDSLLDHSFGGSLSGLVAH